MRILRKSNRVSGGQQGIARAVWPGLYSIVRAFKTVFLKNYLLIWVLLPMFYSHYYLLGFSSIC
jgi:hypothetical protein